jgi:hypothetical protein
LPTPSKDRYHSALCGAWSSAYIPFLNRTPDEIQAEGTILVYRGRFDFSEIAAVRHFDRGLKMLESQHDLEGARTEFAAADPHCPEDLRLATRDGAHYNFNRPTSLGEQPGQPVAGIILVSQTV